MNSLFVVSLQICLIQFVCSQRVNGPAMVNSGLQYGPGVNSIPGQGLNRMGQDLGNNIAGPGMNQMAPNPVLGPFGPAMANAPGFTGSSMANKAFAGMPAQAYASASIPNKGFVAAGIPNQAFNPVYGGNGNGDVAVTGELPVAGMTAVTGHVPLTGKVAFNGNVPCGGIVTITGTCSSCGLNAPIGQLPMPTFGNKPFVY